MHSITSGVGNDDERSNSRPAHDKYTKECTFPCSHVHKKNYNRLEGDSTFITRSVFGFVALSHIIWQARITSIFGILKLHLIKKP